ncbi:glycosyltransferase family 9 protein [Aquabacterium sp.]|jgi:ADP-heptose:LPS heptosyltransferase|uniref:glycosyltransferase family 9 protein n=1 Tax=Aquabacterium sp. TaxID=1872578 RepID=UPI0025C6745E|nr:glycosyltransferase family 9 protein [Aquabacterium sp.]
MKLKQTLRQWLVDLLGHRDDRFYWRQPLGAITLPANARLCLWQPDGKLGDAIVTSMLLCDLAAQRPDVNVTVVVEPGLQSFWRALPQVQEALSCRQDRASLLEAIGACDVFVSFETFLSLETLLLLRALHPAVAIGYNVGRYRIFDRSLVCTSYEWPRKHIAARLQNLCELLSLQHLGSNPLPEVLPSHRTDRSTLPAHPGPTVFLNTHAAGADRTFNASTVAWLIKELHSAGPQARILLSVPGAERPDWLARIQALPPSARSAVALTPDNTSLWEMMWLVQQCDMVVSPDTAVVHVAAALNKPVVAFYRDRAYNPLVWAPLCPHHRQVLPNGTEPCSVNDFDPEAAAQALHGMLHAAATWRPVRPTHHADLPD